MEVSKFLNKYLKTTSGKVKILKKSYWTIIIYWNLFLTIYSCSRLYSEFLIFLQHFRIPAKLILIIFGFWKFSYGILEVYRMEHCSFTVMSWNVSKFFSALFKFLSFLWYRKLYTFQFVSHDLLENCVGLLVILIVNHY